MKKILLLIALDIFCYNSFAQAPATEMKAEQINLDDVIAKSIDKVVSKIKDTQGKVAVMDFPSLDGSVNGLSAYVSNKVGNKLIEVGRQVVDRSTLEKVINEQKLQQNSLMDAATAAKVGKLAGAAVFIVGNFTKTDSKFTLTVRALSVELGQFIPGAVSEEIVRNYSDSFKKEIQELIETKTVVKSDNPLVANTSSSTAEVAPTSGLSKEEIKFDNEMCDQIKPGLKLRKIIDIVLNSGFMSIKDFGSIEGGTQVDELDISKWAYKIGSWAIQGLNIDNGIVSRMIQGTESSENNYVDSWKYNGETGHIKNASACIPHLNWWLQKRGSSSSKKKK